MNDTERLVATEEIRRMRARYLRMLDTKNWQALGNLYAPDATLAFPAEAPGVVFRGRAHIVESISTMLIDVMTIHFGHMGEITIVSDRDARGIWALEDKLWYGPGSTTPGRRVHAYGHLNDRYSKVGGDWLLQDVEISRLRIDESF